MTTDLKIVPSVALLAALAACSPGNYTISKVASPGSTVAAEVSTNADGTYHADRLLVSASSSGDDEGADVEDTGGADDEGADVEDTGGADDEGADVEDTGGADDEEAAADSGDTDDVQCEDGVTPDGQACDDSGDGSGDESASESEDSDGDGDVDSEDKRYATGGSASFIQGSPVALPDRGIYQVMGIDVNPGASALPSGSIVRFDGGYTDGYLAASSVKAGTAVEALGGVSEKLVQTGPNEWRLTLLGRDIIVDGSTEIVPVSAPLQGDEEAASSESGTGSESDGVDCQQEGEHQGNNEGC